MGGTFLQAEFALFFFFFSTIYKELTIKHNSQIHVYMYETNLESEAKCVSIKNTLDLVDRL